MNLYTDTVITELLKDNGETEAIHSKGFRQAKREALRNMYDMESDVYGASFKLEGGTFLKEIHF